MVLTLTEFAAQAYRVNRAGKLPLLVDAEVMARPRIVLGGGSRSWKVIAPSSILVTLPNVEVVDGLANPAAPREPAPGR